MLYRRLWMIKLCRDFEYYPNSIENQRLFAQNSFFPRGLNKDLESNVIIREIPPNSMKNKPIDIDFGIRKVCWNSCFFLKKNKFL